MNAPILRNMRGWILMTVREQLRARRDYGSCRVVDLHPYCPIPDDSENRSACLEKSERHRKKGVRERTISKVDYDREWTCEWSLGKDMSESGWLDRVLSNEAGYECELVGQYTQRLMGLARKQLPQHVRQRFDPEDIVQSVFRSFFRRHQEGQFRFEDSHDVWRLLAAMTFRKAKNAIRFHHRDQRDASREISLQQDGEAGSNHTPIDPSPDPEDVVILVE